MYNEAKVGSKSLQAQASSSFELEESSPSSESNNGGERLKDGNNYRLRAAGLVMREGKDVNDPEVLLVSGMKIATNYIIPGGGLEPGESSKEAALRETMEEAGIVGEIILTVGEFRDEIKKQRTFLYVLRPLQILPEWEDGRRGRTRSWLKLSEARIKIKPRQSSMIEKVHGHVASVRAKLCIFQH